MPLNRVLELLPFLCGEFFVIVYCDEFTVLEFRSVLISRYCLIGHVVDTPAEMFLNIPVFDQPQRCNTVLTIMI